MRDERATPLFAYILGHVDHRGPLRPVYLRAIESLGALRDPEAVEPLKAALYRGEWWAPRRTAHAAAAAAAALARIGTPDAQSTCSKKRPRRRLARHPRRRAAHSSRLRARATGRQDHGDA